jgi:S-(hydroxymethyl)glutathione dehydrogenase/alcohol dehydrogenase
MKAAVLRALGKPVIVEELNLPSLGKGQVLIQMQQAGVCHSQRLEVSGARGVDKFLPHLIGHEGVGLVLEVGPGVTKVKRGEQVVLSWIRGSGEPSDPIVYGSASGPVNAGPLAVFCETPVVSQQCLTPIDPPVEPHLAVLAGCALPTGAGTVWNAMPADPKGSVCILGMGGVGLSAVAGAVYGGWGRIVAVDLRPHRLERAKEIGATHLFQADPAQEEKSLIELSGKNGFDLVVECAGALETMEMAIRIARPLGGKIVIAGNLPAGRKISVDPMHLIQGRTLVGSWGGGVSPDVDIPKFVRLVAQGKINYRLLTGKQFSLEQVNEALAELSGEDPGRPVMNFKQPSREKTGAEARMTRKV